MIQVIHRSLDILELLGAEPGRIFSLGEIAETVGLNRGTCSNILKTLAGRSYVERLAARGGYRLGAMAAPWLEMAERDRQLAAAAGPVLRALSESINETSLIGVIRGTKRITLDSAACDRDLQVRSRQIRDVYETASGRLILAYFSLEEIKSFVDRAGLPQPGIWGEVQSIEDLLAALEDIRRDELARSDSPEHVVGLAVPVRRKDRVVASVSVYLPEVRFNPERHDEILAALRRAGDDVSGRLAAN